VLACLSFLKADDPFNPTKANTFTDCPFRNASRNVRETIPCYSRNKKDEVNMYRNASQSKLNAKMCLIIISLFSLVNAAIGTIIAVKQNLPSVTPILTTGKPAFEDFLTGNGTALSPPLYLCIITLLLIILAFLPNWPGKIGIIGLTILGFMFLLGELVERNTYRVLNPSTFNVPVAIDVLVEIILALLMITFGILTIMQERQFHQQAAK
jgi:hypothetical protein